MSQSQARGSTGIDGVAVPIDRHQEERIANRSRLDQIDGATEYTLQGPGKAEELFERR